MSNALIRGKAPATQVAGALSDGIFFQNLGTAPIFLGYQDQAGAAVSAQSCDGAIQPGGTYKVGAKRDVFLYADVDTPIIWNYDTDASADGGSNVVATGIVSVGNKIAATVDGNVGINGSVAVTGNVGIAGSVAVAGDVNVLGTIKNKSQQTVDQLGSNPDFYSYPGNYQEFFAGDVSQYNTILFSAKCNNPNGNRSEGMVQIQCLWYDGVNSTALFEESALVWCCGNVLWNIPVKSPYLRIAIWGDNLVNNPSRFWFRAQGSTYVLPETYMSYLSDANNQNGYNAGSVSLQQQSLSGYGKTINYKHVLGNDGYSVLVPTSFSGRARGGTYCGGYSGFRARYGKFNISHANIQPELAVDTLNQTVNYELVMPRAPLFLESVQSGQGGTVTTALSWGT